MHISLGSSGVRAERERDEDRKNMENEKTNGPSLHCFSSNALKATQLAALAR